jgi:hypothetical protein
MGTDQENLFDRLRDRALAAPRLFWVVTVIFVGFIVLWDPHTFADATLIQLRVGENLPGG